MTQGHNIVADGWAGASNPQPNPNPHPSHTNIHKKYPKRLFFHFLTQSLRIDQRSNGPMDQRMDKASFRFACPQLKTSSHFLTVIFMICNRQISVAFAFIFSPAKTCWPLMLLSMNMNYYLIQCWLVSPLILSC